MTENRKQADSYLEKAANNCEWAMMLKAKRLSVDKPKAALAIFLDLAKRGNCHAQAILTKSYLRGELSPPNQTKAYFWGLIASSGGYSRKSETHRLGGGRSLYSNSCLHYEAKYTAEKGLPARYIEMAQDAAGKWSRGMDVPVLPAPPRRMVGKRKAPKPAVVKPKYPRSTPVKAKTRASGKRIHFPQWKSLGIVATTSNSIRLDARELYEIVKTYVWTIASASTKENLLDFRGVATGSAVAVGDFLLITNNHIIENRPFMVIAQGKKAWQARVRGADGRFDRCSLTAMSQHPLTYVRHFRKISSLSIGESVYTIGSPRGLDSTLGEGIISGLRTVKGARYIQTTAPISLGSSGGGLFDQYGNLIGITTFTIKESEGLNFAIAIDEFLIP